MSVTRNVTVPTGLVAAVKPELRSVMLLLRLRPKPLGQAAEDRQGKRWIGEQCRLEVPRGQGQAASLLDGDDLGNARLAVEDRELAEELAGSQDGELLPVADDPDRALGDDEEARPDLALPGDHPIRRELDLDGAVGEVGEVGGPDTAEQAAGAEHLRPAILAEGQDCLLNGCACDGMMLPPTVPGVNLSMGIHRPYPVDAHSMPAGVRMRLQLASV
jgi:hypothetical protein